MLAVDGTGFPSTNKEIWITPFHTTIRKLDSDFSCLPHQPTTVTQTLNICCLHEQYIKHPEIIPKSIYNVSWDQNSSSFSVKITLTNKQNLICIYHWLHRLLLVHGTLLKLKLTPWHQYQIIIVISHNGHVLLRFLNLQ